VARVTKDVKQNGRTVIHKGDRLVGHVTDVQAAATSKASSRLAVQFDSLMSGESSTQLHTVITSLFSSRAEGSAQEEEMGGPMLGPGRGPVASGGGRGAGGGGLLGGVGSTVNAAGSVAGNVGSTASSTLGGATNAAGSAVGGVGAGVGATARAAGSNNTSAGLATPISSVHILWESGVDQQAGANSVLTTRHGGLRVESGTQMQFRVAAQSEAGGEAK
jgi:hypothetical protein